MLLKLKDDLVTLSCNKFGSRVVDTLWSWSNMKHKGIIAGALSERESQMNSNQFGKFLSEKCALSAFKRNPLHDFLQDP